MIEAALVLFKQIIIVNSNWNVAPVKFSKTFDSIWNSLKSLKKEHINLLYELFTEAEKKAQVSKIEWEQKITEKESQKKISQIEGIVFELALMEKHVFTLWWEFCFI